MTNYIINPKNGNTISIFSHEGKHVLRNYLWTLKQNGGYRKHKRCKSCGKRFMRERQYGGIGSSHLYSQRAALSTDQRLRVWRQLGRARRQRGKIWNLLQGPKEAAGKGDGNGNGA